MSVNSLPVDLERLSHGVDDVRACKTTESRKDFCAFGKSFGGPGCEEESNRKNVEEGVSSPSLLRQDDTDALSGSCITEAGHTAVQSTKSIKARQEAQFKVGQERLERAYREGRVRAPSPLPVVIAIVESYQFIAPGITSRSMELTFSPTDTVADVKKSAYWCTGGVVDGERMSLTDSCLAFAHPAYENNLQQIRPSEERKTTLELGILSIEETATPTLMLTRRDRDENVKSAPKSAAENEMAVLRAKKGRLLFEELMLPKTQSEPCSFTVEDSDHKKEDKADNEDKADKKSKKVTFEYSNLAFTESEDSEGEKQGGEKSEHVEDSHSGTQNDTQGSAQEDKQDFKDVGMKGASQLGKQDGLEEDNDRKGQDHA